MSQEVLQSPVMMLMMMMMMMMLLIGINTNRVLRDDGDPASQFAQPKLGDVHLGHHYLCDDYHHCDDYHRHNYRADHGGYDQ